MASPNPDEMTQAALAAAFWKKAWGTSWLSDHTSRVAITRRDLLGADHEHSPFENEYGPFEPDAQTREWVYDCIDGVMDVGRIFGMSSKHSDALVVLEEYPLLLYEITKTFVESASNVTLTGHPGIGKTTFLLYTLLRRLANEQPTAIHAGGSTFVLFSFSGAQTLEAAAQTSMFPEGCWALSDVNRHNPTPCFAFTNPGLFVVHATSPCDSQVSFSRREPVVPLFFPLPKVSEIAAIASSLRVRSVNYGEGGTTPPSEQGPIDLLKIVTLVRSWGPCTRTILAILRHPTRHGERIARMNAYTAADKLCTTPTVAGSGAANGEASAVFFLGPDPTCPFNNLRTSLGGSAFIPTAALSEIFADRLRTASNEAVLQLFRILRRHGSDTGCERMHGRLVCLCSLPIVGPNGEQETISPARTIAPGTLASLGQISGHPPQYWIPPATPESNFVGIDALLVDDRCVYAFQAQHRNPSEGLRNVWERVDKRLRAEREWRVVVCGDPDEQQDLATVVGQIRSDLESFALDSACKVTVWSAGDWHLNSFCSGKTLCRDPSYRSV